MESSDHKRTGIEQFNRYWELLEKQDLTATDDVDLLTVAFTSRFHWSYVGDRTNFILVDWMVSRAAAAIGEGDLAVRFALLAYEGLKNLKLESQYALCQDEKMSPQESGDRYVEPGWFTQHVFNQLVKVLTRMGISVWGSRILWVRGRTSGEWRTNPVNLLFYNGDQYLVAPRGATQWVRNLRAAGNGELRVGRKAQAFEATELGNTEKIEVLKAYLQRWKLEVGVFFDGVSATSPLAELDRIAPNHPVFRLTSTKTR